MVDLHKEIKLSDLIPKRSAGSPARAARSRLRSAG